MRGLAMVLRELMVLRIGTSTRSDAQEAAQEAVAAALKECASPAFALVFSTLEFAPEVIVETVTQALGAIPWAGCTTPAVLVNAGLLRSAVAVGIIDAADVQVGIGVGDPAGEGPREAGRAAASAALASLPVPPGNRSRALILLCDSRTGAGADVVRGAAGVAGAGVAWAGGGTGSAADGTLGAQFANGAFFRSAAIVIALDFGARVGAGIHHGWEPFGPPAMITAASGNVVRQLEYQNAFEIYQAVAADHGQRVTPESFALYAPAHPLGIPQATGEHLIRDPISIEPDGGIRCVAEIPDGALVRVMRGQPEALVEAAGKAAAMACADAGGPLGGAFIFDCVSRFYVLGEAIQLELEAFRRALG
ncbi:MAG: hypothetical protein H6Q89_1008, partial [Myxococcaceae bacterium]|nr:hypothetical protein [Myxococcaceae bacterium]